MLDLHKILRPKYLLFVVLAAYFFFGVQHLTQFITADEHYWIYERIPQYWEAWDEGKWKKTFINDKPGVSLALVSGIGLLFEPQPESLCTRTEEKVITCNTTRTERLLFVFRFPILFINALLMLYLFWVIGKITNKHIALWTTLFIAFSPQLIGISQIVNPDALLWSFGAASVFSYFALLKYRERKYFVLSGVFLGFALLSKYTAGILIPFFLMATVLSSMLLKMPSSDQGEYLREARKDLLAFLYSILIAAATVILLLPAIWVKPSVLQNLLSGGSERPLILLSLGIFACLLIDSTLLKGKLFLLLHFGMQKIRAQKLTQYLLPGGMLLLFSTLIIGRMAFPDWNLFERIPFDAKDLTGNDKDFGPIPTLLQSILLETNPLIFSLPPVVLVLLFISLLRVFFSVKERSFTNFTRWLTILFLPVYIAALILMDVLAAPRYLIILYPIVSFLAAVGLWDISEVLRKKLSPRLQMQRFKTVFLTGVVAIFSLASLVGSYPFYFNYSNAFLSKDNLVTDAWGFGGYEAAQYLNSLPNAENLLVWTDYEGVCEFFVGKCLTAYTFDKEAIQPDYYVLTRRGQIRYMSRYTRWERLSGLTAYKYYDIPDPDWQLFIGNRPGNFVKVVKVT